jgi:hypothetical protein
MHLRRSTAWLPLLLGCLACSPLGPYGTDRMRDLSDVIDVRYGTGFGLGSQVQVLWLATGLGASTEHYYRQWFGRKSVEVRTGLFANVLILGIEGDFWRRDFAHMLGDSSTGALSVLVINLSLSSSVFSLADKGDWFKEPAGDPPFLDGLRIGGTLFLPGVNGGLYLNFGELLDFLCGVIGYDPLGDDGIPKFQLVGEGE